MSEKIIPKKQHYVPKFYLKEFANDYTYGKKDKAQIHVYDKKNKKTDIRNIKTIAYSQYLYSPKNENGHRSAYMEDKLADLESQMSKVWNQFANNRMVLSLPLKKLISLFMATLIYRHPDNLIKNQYMKEFLYNAMMNHIPEGEKSFIFSANGKESIITVSEMEESMNTSDYVQSKDFIDNIEHFAIDTMEILIKKKWSIVTSKEKIFITSDRPIIVKNPKTGFEGIAAEGAEIYLPLSPTKILVLEDNFNNDETLTEYKLKKGYSAFYNDIIWSNAYQYVISHKDLQKTGFDILKFKQSRKKPWWKFW